jgi:anthranilate synthase component II
MNILIVDNHDSFVYNIVHLLDAFNLAKISVVKNDALNLESIIHNDKIVLSPGPGLPKDAGLMPELIREYIDKKPILGVCLGHQAIVEYFGGKLKNLQQPLHGVSTKVKITSEDYLFKHLPDSFEIGHYHSWVAEQPLPELLQATSVDEFGNVMSFKHKTLDVRGVQYHPESILTPFGRQILENWLRN